VGGGQARGSPEIGSVLVGPRRNGVDPRLS
jgi:hypothetical protein